MKIVVSAYYDEGIVKKAIQTVWNKKYDEAINYFEIQKGISSPAPKEGTQRSSSNFV